MIAVPIQPRTRMGRLDVNAPITDFLEAIRRITTINGTATTPLMTALQNSAFIGLHTRMVAATAAKIGMKCVVIQETWVPHEDAVYDRVGNILMTRSELGRVDGVAFLAIFRRGQATISG
jgi:hypothetical protein